MKTTFFNTQENERKQLRTDKTSGGWLTTMWSSWKGQDWTQEHSTEFSFCQHQGMSEMQHERMSQNLKGLGWKEMNNNK